MWRLLMQPPEHHPNAENHSFSKDGSLRPMFLIKRAVFWRFSNVCTYISQNNLSNYWNSQKNFNSKHVQMANWVFIQFKFNASRYKPCGATPHFSTGQNLLKKILRKDNYLHNQLRKAFDRWSQIMQYTVTRRF